MTDAPESEREAIVRIIRSEVRVTNPPDDIDPWVINAEQVADAILSRMGGEPVALREAYERLNMAEDLLGDALDYLDAPSHYAGPEGIMKEIEDYFEFKMSGRSALTASPPAPALGARTVEAGARAIAKSQGHDPDDMAPRTIMCTVDNEQVPWWKVFEDEAEACALAIHVDRGK